MSLGRPIPRREFLRLAGLASLGAIAAACGGRAPETRPTEGSLSPTASPSPRPRVLAWLPLDAQGPGARRDHTFTGSEDGALAVVFGGRASGQPLADTWVYEVGRGTWTQIGAEGPVPRFGHNAVFTGERLFVFGGQGGPGEFFNDVWELDPGRERWRDVSPGGSAPSPRYGAGGTAVDGALTITHGFTDAGRFDDTWSLDGGWEDVSPTSGARPIMRCLHRAVWVPVLRRVVLFGGQTTGVAYLDDVWLYDPEARTWTEAARRPVARNLYAAGVWADGFLLFGGLSAEGPLDDLWSFDGSRWERLRPDGRPPPGRGGIEGAMVGGPSMLVFGGTTGSAEIDDLWELTLPA